MLKTTITSIFSTFNDFLTPPPVDKVHAPLNPGSATDTGHR